MPTLPKLIFLEMHDDGTCKRIITKLLPDLKSVGYGCFYDEMPSSVSLQDYLEAKPKLNCYKSRKELAQGLKEHQIGYKSIDLEDMIPLHATLNQLEQELIEATCPVRDQALSYVYLSTSQNIFGLNGLAHAAGIQKNILEHFSKDEAENNFMFVFLYNSQEIFLSPKKYLKAPQMEITAIDALHHCDETIIQEIIGEIKRKTTNQPRKIIPPIPKDYRKELQQVVKAQEIKSADPLRQEAIQTFVVPINNIREKNIIDARLALLNYLSMRKEERYKETISGYFSLFGKFIGMSFDVKSMAARKIINLLKNNPIKPFSEQEIDALRDGRLGEIIRKIETLGILPAEFQQAENTVKIGALRLLR